MLLCLLMAPSSQESEPPGNPGRFILSVATCVSSLLGWSQDRENHAVAIYVKTTELLHHSEGH